MRPRRVVATAALIAALASVVIPGEAGSHAPGREQQLADGAFSPVSINPDLGMSTTTLTLDPDFFIGESAPDSTPPSLPIVEQPVPPVIVTESWRFARELSWYGPGFYGQHTACGQVLTMTLLGVANRTLPCGTLVTFRNPANGRTITVPVVDRGPYVEGRNWDLTYATCHYLGHCYTGSMYWRRA